MTENPHVEDGERPTAEQIATRIDLGDAEYHETCCAWRLSTDDESLFVGVQACNCGGPEMAKAYVEYARALQCLADGDYDERLSPGGYAEAVLRQQA